MYKPKNKLPQILPIVVVGIFVVALSIGLTVNLPKADASVINQSADSVWNPTRELSIYNQNNTNKPEVQPALNVDILKSVDKTTANEGETLTYTITVSNKGDGEINDLMVTDTLPANTTLVADSFNPAPTVNDGANFTWKNISLVANSNTVISYQVTINGGLPVGQTVITNTAILKCMEMIPQESIATLIQCNLPEDSSTVASTITKLAAPAPVLSLVKSVDKVLTNPGATLNYTITVSNSGPGDAVSVKLTDTLPSGFTFLDDQGNNTGDASKEWPAFDLISGKDTTFKYQVHVDSKAIAQKYTNTATVQASNFTTPVKATAVTEIKIPTVLGAETPSLTITKSVNKTSANPGDTVSYTVIITNNGGAVAMNVVLTDTLPAGFIFTETNATTQTWKLGDLAPTESVTKTYEVKLDASLLPGQYLNTASVTADNINPISAQATLEVKEIPVLGAEDEIKVLGAELPNTGNGLLGLLSGALLISAGLFVNRKTR